MVIARVAPESRGVLCPGLADRGDDFLAPREQLANKLEADASAGADNDPGRHVLVGVQGVWDLIHFYTRDMIENDSRWVMTSRTDWIDLQAVRPV